MTEFKAPNKNGEVLWQEKCDDKKAPSDAGNPPGGSLFIMLVEDAESADREIVQIVRQLRQCSALARFVEI